MKLKILDRFFNHKTMGKEETLEQIKISAKASLGNMHGETLLIHLINFYELDKPSGCLPEGASNYRNGTQDVVKYLISLVTDEE